MTIDKLTPEQEAKIPEYLNKYRAIGLSTTPCDRAKAEAALRAAYKYRNLADPEIIWADSPFAGAKIAAQHANGTYTPTQDQIREQAGLASYGSFEAYWVSFYDFVATELPVQKDELIDIVKDIVVNCGVFWNFEDLVILTEKPVRISMMDGKLHNTDSLALMYKDGTGITAINGVAYPSLLEATLDATLSKDAKT